MKLKDIIAVLERLAPPSLQEGYDNSGLLVGSGDDAVNGAVIALDCTEEVIDEAIRLEVNLVIAHHPIVFSGLKRFNGKNYVERTIMKAIRHGISIYAIHTNLDNVIAGVNGYFAKQLNLADTAVLRPKENILQKVIVYVPIEHQEQLRSAMFAAGGGQIGNYDECSFNVAGEGTFKANDDANPFVGERGERHIAAEVRIEMICEVFKMDKVISAMKKAHPYEEVAHEIISIQNSYNRIGSGIVGNLEHPMKTDAFLNLVKEKFNLSIIKHTRILKEEVRRVALCGGSGVFLLGDAKRAGADVFITADVKYHEFFDADNDLVLADIGHYESEQKTGELLAAELKHNFNTFAVHLSTINTNPVNYY
ncbi:MAG: Nif3-like dinuclear metal center hexameric protein [Cryomorphaceae bacterium]|nr:Nif3-like dinuclear metal center hexameric protein [Cryomorphaceae bacterium]